MRARSTITKSSRVRCAVVLSATVSLAGCSPDVDYLTAGWAVTEVDAHDAMGNGGSAGAASDASADGRGVGGMGGSVTAGGGGTGSMAGSSGSAGATTAGAGGS